jgi:hypothetical protein
MQVSRASAAPIAGPSPRDALWEHCRNNLGIARLLVQEHRPEPFVATACRMAVESACRAALAHAEFVFDGDVDRALSRLSVPEELWPALDAGSGSQKLAAAEKIVAWLSSYLRSEAPERAWGF